MRGEKSGPCEVTTVLLLDDYEPQLFAWERERIFDGRTVLKATTRTAALELAARHRPELAVVDLFLGPENGIDALLELKGFDAQMFVAVVSSHITVALTMAAVRAGADEVYIKPVRCAEIVTRMEDRREVETPLERRAETKLTLDQIEWEHISRVMLDCNENITRAAVQLGVYRQTLQRKLRKRGVARAR
jgi:two-component system response regulator RegA